MPLATAPVKPLSAKHEFPPAAIVHGLAHARTAVALGRPVTLLSAPGAASFMGCLWWKAIVDATAAPHVRSILDCADAPGRALEAFRVGVQTIVLCPEAIGRDAVLAIAKEAGFIVLDARPEALDMARRDALHRLPMLLGAAPR